MSKINTIFGVYILISLFIFFGCVSKQISESLPDNLSNDKGRLYNGKLYRIDKNNFEVETNGARTSNSEGYFEVPVNLEKPFMISAEINYRVMNMDDTVRFIFPGGVYYYCPWREWEDYDLTPDDKSVPIRSVRGSTYGDSNTIVVYVSKDSKATVFGNNLARFYEMDINPSKRRSVIGFKFRAMPRLVKKARVSNLTIITGEQAEVLFKSMVDASNKLWTAIQKDNEEAFMTLLKQEAKRVDDLLAEQRRREAEEEKKAAERRENMASFDDIFTAMFGGVIESLTGGGSGSSGGDYSGSWTCRFSCTGHTFNAPDYPDFEVKASGNLADIHDKINREYEPVCAQYPYSKAGGSGAFVGSIDCNPW